MRNVIRFLASGLLLGTLCLVAWAAATKHNVPKSKPLAKKRMTLRIAASSFSIENLLGQCRVWDRLNSEKNFGFALGNLCSPITRLRFVRRKSLNCWSATAINHAPLEPQTKFCWIFGILDFDRKARVVTSSLYDPIY